MRKENAKEIMEKRGWLLFEDDGRDLYFYNEEQVIICCVSPAYDNFEFIYTTKYFYKLKTGKRHTFYRDEEFNRHLKHLKRLIKKLEEVK